MDTNLFTEGEMVHYWTGSYTGYARVRGLAYEGNTRLYILENKSQNDPVGQGYHYSCFVLPESQIRALIAADEDAPEVRLMRTIKKMVKVF